MLSRLSGGFRTRDWKGRVYTHTTIAMAAAILVMVLNPSADMAGSAPQHRIQRRRGQRTAQRDTRAASLQEPTANLEAGLAASRKEQVDLGRQLQTLRGSVEALNRSAQELHQAASDLKGSVERLTEAEAELKRSEVLPPWLNFIKEFFATPYYVVGGLGGVYLLLGLWYLVPAICHRICYRVTSKASQEDSANHSMKKFHDHVRSLFTGGHGGGTHAQ